MAKKRTAKKRAAPKRAPARKKARVETFCFEDTDPDPIIENLREVSLKHNHVRNIDTEILDQVALEGLTGATFGRLCLILDAVIQKLDSCHNGPVQDYIWSVLVNGFMRRKPGASIQVFHLNESQQNSPVKTQNSDGDSYSGQNKSYCIDKPIQLPRQSLTRMAKSDWMLHPVLDGQIMGSCPKYTCRENISQEVMQLYDELGSRESLLAINEKFDLKKVYFVADQEVRRRALLPKSYDPNIDLKLREYACLELIGQTRCFGMVFPNDKNLGRYRILLTAKGLITQYQATCQAFIVHHLRRFSQFNVDVGSKAFKSGQIMLAKSKVKHNSNEDDDDDELDIESNSGATIKGTCCNPARLKCDRNILKIVYDTIAMSKGRSLLDIRRKLRLPKSHIRNHLKNLANTELIGSHTKFLFDKKTRIYRARHKSNKRKMMIARQKKPIKGVMAKWDEADVRARKYLGLKRSSFSQAEDSLLTLCRITGLLLDPTYPKTFTVPKQIIRDILHDELPESYDKTSDALLRRVKYLGRLDKNILLINEITAELSDDTDVRRLIDSAKDLKKTDDKRCNLFQQLFQVIKAKLPHLLGLTSSLLTGSTFEIENFDDLTNRFELIDCHKAPTKKKTYHQPLCTLVQLVRSTKQCYQLRLTKCEDMQTVMLISSRCTQTCFNLQMKLKFPLRAVALDHDNANFKVIFEKAKESREASRMIANLTTTNPSADSRRALFMLRNAPKLQNMDKCGKLTDALIIQPCDIEFFSDEEITFDGKNLLNHFLNTSKFSNEKRGEHNESQAELARLKKNEYSRVRRRRTVEVGGDKSRLDGATTSTEADIGAPSSSAKDISKESESLNKQDKLFKMIESIMSWVGAFPGIELDNLKTKLEPLLGESLDEHLSELLELMESLELISRDCMVLPEYMCRKPCLFGYKALTDRERQPVISFAPKENAYVRLCQLIDVEL